MNNDLICLVEEDHWYDINQYTWNCYKNENDRIYGYPSGYVNGKTIQLHIYVYKKYIGEIPLDMSVDHIKSEAILDVRLQNLRIADRSLQAHNQDRSKNRIDEYKGIKPTISGYTVEINRKYYGLYQTAEKAAEKLTKFIL